MEALWDRERELVLSSSESDREKKEKQMHANCLNGRETPRQRGTYRQTDSF